MNYKAHLNLISNKGLTEAISNERLRLGFEILNFLTLKGVNEVLTKFVILARVRVTFINV